MAEYDVTVKMDLRPLVSKMRYFYNQMKFIDGDTELRKSLYRRMLEYAEEDYGFIGMLPIKTGALQSSTPAYEDVNKEEISDNHYAYGWIDEDGIHWNPYHISKNYPGGFYYINQPNINWNYGRPNDILMSHSSSLERAVIDELFNGADGLKKWFPLGVSKKNEYILDLGQVK